MTNMNTKSINMTEVAELKAKLDGQLKRGRYGYNPYRIIADKLRYCKPEGHRFVKDFFAGKIKYPKLQHQKMVVYARQLTATVQTQPCTED